MSDIDTKTVTKVAHLARIALDDDEAQHYAEDLNKILNVVTEMQAIDTAGVEPLSHPLDMDQRLRQDSVTETNKKEQLMANAPKKMDGLFLVPRVVE